MLIRNFTAAALFGLGQGPLAIAPAGASPVTVVNPSFEMTSRPMAIGEQTNGMGGAGVEVGVRFPFAGSGVLWDDPVIVPGWRSIVPPSGSPSIVRAGVLNPPDVGPGPFITGQDGQHVGVTQNAAFGQTLAATLRAETRYTLTFKGGIGLFDSDYFIAVSLIAVDDMTILPLENQPGVTRLEIGRYFPPRETFGTLQDYTLEYTTPAVLPPDLMGRHVGIQIFGSDGIPRIVVDDFALDATRVPGAGSLAALALLAGWRGRRRVRATLVA